MARARDHPRFSLPFEFRNLQPEVRFLRFRLEPGARPVLLGQRLQILVPFAVQIVAGEAVLFAARDQVNGVGQNIGEIE